MLRRRPASRGTAIRTSARRSAERAEARQERGRGLGVRARLPGRDDHDQVAHVALRERARRCAGAPRRRPRSGTARSGGSRPGRARHRRSARRGRPRGARPRRARRRRVPDVGVLRRSRAASCARRGRRSRTADTAAASASGSRSRRAACSARPRRSRAPPSNSRLITWQASSSHSTRCPACRTRCRASRARSRPRRRRSRTRAVRRRGGRRDRHLGEHRRVPVGVAGDHAADPHAARRLGHRPEQRPALEHVEHGVAHDRREVVEVPEVVEAGLVGDLPDRAELGDVGVLLRELQADPDRFHDASLPAADAYEPTRSATMRASLAITPSSSAEQVRVAVPAAANVCVAISATGSSELEERSAST